MGISEKKMQIVINNYFKQECDVNTSIREAFEKGFRIGVKKGLSAQPDRDIPVKPIWITDSAWGIPSRQAVCPKCDYYLMKVYFIPNDTADTTHSRKVSYCGNCGQAIDWSEWEDEE